MSAGEPPRPSTEAASGSDEAQRLDASALSARDTYRLMTDLVAPRPIAWVSTVDGQGRGNLAPFSYFQAVCSAPATVVVAIGSRPDGQPKDTLANILRSREFTVSHVGEHQADAMNNTAAAYPPGQSEWATADAGSPLASAPSFGVQPPRVAAARAAMECRMTHAIPLGTGRHGAPSTTLVIATVLHFWVAPSRLRRNDRGHLLPIEPGALGAVGRLGGIAYARTTDVFELPRPKV